MSPFTVVRSRAILVCGENVDTDQIIPAQYVNAVGTQALADALFRRLRDRDPGFAFNRPQAAGRAILVVGRNFGCGSSREAAAWALGAWGIRALIGLSFNPTFHGNCLQNGLLPVQASEPVHARLLEALDADPELEIVVDLEHERVQVPQAGIEFPAGVEPFARELLLRGMDELDYLLARVAEIQQFEDRHGEREG